MYFFIFYFCNSCTFIHLNKIFFSISTVVLYYVYILCVFEIQSGFVIFPKRGRLLSCIPCFSLFLLSCFGKILKHSLNLFFPCLYWLENGISRLLLEVRKNLKQIMSWNLSHVCLEIVVLYPRDVILTFFYWQSSNELLHAFC